ncbi:hypothetical protein ACG04R_09865 [Roseateles sp. BYS78W]|uniref:Uncharacterized protein n=1 Tax=Pelomonas candidula TaxID=3299025 RepID=A0ABW7HBC9_9BURK
MNLRKSFIATFISTLATAFVGAPAFAHDDHDRGPDRATLLVTSTNNATANNIVVFRLDTNGAASLSYVTSLATGGAGGAGGNAGLVQFHDDIGAVANYGSNSVTQLVRQGDFVHVGRSFDLASGCTRPVSIALKHDHLYVAGANCVESHDWPSGRLDGTAVSLPDASSAQVVAGRSWAAVTMKSGSVLQLPLNREGRLAGTGSVVALPAGANDTPLGAAFWGDLLGFNPAHSPNSLALVSPARTVYPIAGPTPAFPNGNAPCWLVKGPGNLWYSGNTPAKAISIFFSDGVGGSFYKSVPLPGAPTDLTVSPDGKWLAVIYTAADGGHIGVYALDAYGDLTPAATTGAIGVPSFNGVAFSQ